MYKSKNSAMNTLMGATLIEMVIALTISLLVSGSLVSIYLATKSNHELQISISTIKENAASVTQIVESEISKAGYIGCAKLNDDFPVYNTTDYDYSIRNKIQTDDSMLIVRYVSQESNSLINDMRNNSILYIDRNNNLKIDDIMSISTCEKADMFKIKKIELIDNNSEMIETYKPLSTHYKANSEIRKFEMNTYYTENTDRKNAQDKKIQALYIKRINQNKSELVDGVSNMRFIVDYDRLNQPIGVSIMMTIDSMSETVIDKKWFIYAALRN